MCLHLRNAHNVPIEQWNSWLFFSLWNWKNAINQRPVKHRVISFFKHRLHHPYPVTLLPLQLSFTFTFTSWYSPIPFLSCFSWFSCYFLFLLFCFSNVSFDVILSVRIRAHAFNLYAHEVDQTCATFFCQTDILHFLLFLFLYVCVCVRFFLFFA